MWNRAFPYEERLKDIYAEKVAFLQVSWGEFPRQRVDEAHRAGVKVVHMLGSVEAALKAAEAGVDAIIAQGVEAGGHVMDQACDHILNPKP
jgi:NAD(P)H-dependent flavin oxidoreductase YrpB (nitropropane dioxygenase family)